MFYRESVFFFRPLLSELAERHSTKTGHMLGSKCDLKMHVRNLGYILALQIGDRASVNGRTGVLYARRKLFDQNAQN